MFGNIYGLSRPFGIPRKFRRFSKKFKNLQKRGVFFKECIYIMDIGPQVAVEPRKGHMNTTRIIKGGDYASKNNSQTSRKAARKSTPAPEKNGGDGNCESKEIRVRQRLEWSVNTPDLLKDIIPNMRASESISPSIITIFGSLLAEVAKRATELHDPKLDSLMLRLNLYEF